MVTTYKKKGMTRRVSIIEVQNILFGDGRRITDYFLFDPQGGQPVLCSWGLGGDVYLDTIEDDDLATAAEMYLKEQGCPVFTSDADVKLATKKRRRLNP